jgi:hypothetical protein
MTTIRQAATLAVTVLLAAGAAVAQQGRGGPPVQGAEEDIPLVSRFDRNRDKQLDREERMAAREFLVANPERRRPLPRPRITRTGTPGVPLAPKDVKHYGEKVSLYDPETLRTLFLEFEHPDWEQELAAFYHTAVELPATLVAEGKRYGDVGASFRGNNSFTGAGRPETSWPRSSACAKC